MKINVEIKEFKGKTYVDIRKYYQQLGESEWKPSQKGIMISVEEFPEVMTELKKIEASLNQKEVTDVS